MSGYCDYLDTEMTIMGLLSTFAVVVPALVLDRTGGADPTKPTYLGEVWKDQRVLLGAGSVSFALAALFFYKQRSLLAYYVGQLRFSETVACYEEPTTKELLEDADSWGTWVNYQTAFVFLTLGFTLYLLAFFQQVWLALSPWPTVSALFAAAIACAVVNAIVMTLYRYHDYPWSDCYQLKTPIRR